MGNKTATFHISLHIREWNNVRISMGNIKTLGFNILNKQIKYSQVSTFGRKKKPWPTFYQNKSRLRRFPIACMYTPVIQLWDDLGREQTKWILDTRPHDGTVTMQQPHSSAQYTAVWLLCIYPLTALNSSAKTSRREIKTLVLMSISISILASYTNPALLFRLLRCKQPAWSTRDWINVKYDSKKWKQIKNIKLKYGLRGGTIFFFFYRTLRQCL